jgi:hypothetical protein
MCYIAWDVLWEEQSKHSGADVSCTDFFCFGLVLVGLGLCPWAHFINHISGCSGDFGVGGSPKPFAWPGLEP